MNQKLTIEKFLDFQQQLQREILSLEVPSDQMIYNHVRQSVSYFICMYSCVVWTTKSRWARQYYRGGLHGITAGLRRIFGEEEGENAEESEEGVSI